MVIIMTELIWEIAYIRVIPWKCIQLDHWHIEVILKSQQKFFYITF